MTRPTSGFIRSFLSTTGSATNRISIAISTCALRAGRKRR
ncbi:hypothetical protein EVA_09949 [gut metagenome]|uniref:Uncharacterized protein n=1 Tax=gut metagenome TaxID=749906 RepID=J9G4Z6_9ZZZZ